MFILPLTLALSFSTSIGLLGTAGQPGQTPVYGALDSLHDLSICPHHVRQIIGNAQVMRRTIGDVILTCRSILPDVLPVAFKPKPIAQRNLRVLERFGIVAAHGKVTGSKLS